MSVSELSKTVFSLAAANVRLGQLVLGHLQFTGFEQWFVLFDICAR